MDRNREARRTTMAASNGLARRRRNSLRDSPEEDGPVELQETARLRDRGGSGKKDRDRDRDRERDRERERERDRDRLSRSKRRRGDRLMHGSNREDGGDDSSEESVNDDEEDEDDDGGGGGASVRMLPPPNPSVSLSSSSSSMLNHHRKSFPPAKSFRAAPAWKATDEMIGVSVPRKARSASTKRSHEWASCVGIVGESINQQASTSPVRPSLSSMAAPAASPAPVSPSSSNPSLMRKKLKPNGPKLRPPKTSPKPSSSAQDEIEIEIAEVLYEMMRQPQGPSKQENLAPDSIKFESREANKSTSDAKSRVSSPISNSPSALPQSSQQALPQNSSSSVTLMPATAPKRKRPRPVKYEDENPSIFNVQNSPISSTTKLLPDPPAEIETYSPNPEKNSGSAAENGGVAYDLAQSHPVPASTEAQPESIKAEGNLVPDSKLVSEKSDSQDLGMSKEESQSPKKDSPGLRLDDNREDMTTTKANLSVTEIEIQREEKFQIDLMAPPPLRSSPERDGEMDFVAVDAKPMVIDTETEIKPMIKGGDAKTVKIVKEDNANVEIEKSKITVVVEEAESKKPTVVKERNIDLQLDLEKTDRDSGTAGVSGNKLQQQHVPKQPQQHITEKNAQSSSLPLPMSMPGWPGGLPTMGYMAPLQGVVSMDGSTVSSAAIQPPPYLFNQPRPKRCATHCYIARNICYHQQIARMNSFWPAATGSGPLYGAKPCNLNVLPSTEMHGNIPGRGVNSAHEKGQGLAIFPGHAGKDKGSQAANIGDAAQRKQILLQQAPPPGAPSNILHGPAFIFPLSQQQAAAAASVRPGSVKSPPTAASVASSSTPNSTTVSAMVTPGAAAPAMSFNYPNMPTETQYLAILQNNAAYSFPIPAHVGAPPAYRGTHAQMPFFNGSFYSSPMLHPSQLQQQQPPNHTQQSQQGHQNTSISSGSSSSQKHLQNQQHRPHASGINGGSGSLQGFPASKGQSSQPLQLHQRQQQQNQHIPHQARQLESEIGGEDSPSTADSRVSRASMSIYGQNFAMPIHTPNFALMNPSVSLGGANGPTGASGSNSEKKQQQQQQQSAKGGVEASQAFAMSFANINGATPGLDIAQHQAFFQSVPDVRQGCYQFMAAAAAAQAAQQKKNYRVPEDGKAGGDSSNMEEERKAVAGKASSTVGQSIAFSRPDLSDTPGSNVIDSSARTLNLGSNPSRTSSSVVPAVIGSVNAPNSQQQLQRNQQQQQQMNQLQKQHLAAAARTKTPATSNGSVYSDHLPSTSMAAKFPNALSSFPQNLVQSSSTSTSQPPQWKNSVRTSTSQVPPPSMASSNSSSLKNLPQQQGRMQQSHTQISFAANPKGPTQPQGLQPTSSSQSPSPPIMVGSPTTSMSKSAGGSPRTTTSSTGNKASQASSLSAQQAKNSPTMGNLKSSPVGGRNVPSILGNPHITSSSSAGTKPQLSQQQQQQLSKQSVQQAQLIFSNAYMQAQASHSNSNNSNASAMSGYYNQRRRNDQQPQQSQQLQNSSGTSSSGMLSLCPPVTLSNTSTSDPAKAAAVAAAACNMKGALPSQALIHPAQFAAAQSGNPHQLMPAGFPYVHAAVPTAVQVKPAEQKQPAGE